MKAYNCVKNEIEHHEEMLNNWYSQDAWYRHSTAGIKQKALYEYAIEVLKGIRDSCEEGQF